MNDNTVIYEQPLNELIRVCLRLEQLFLLSQHNISDTSTFGTRSMVATIIHILHLLDRPDLKAKLAKELSYHHTALSRLTKTPGIDQEKLSLLLHQIEDLIRVFIDSSGKIGQPLREVELLNNLRLHLASPGGGCSFDIPIYHYWLQQSVDGRLTTIKSWLREFDQIRLAIEIVLRLIRESAKVHNKVAENGFYQELLDPQVNLRLLRVAVPKKLKVFPEISLGRHYLSIRYFTPHIVERATACTDNVSFWLSHCGN